ncbi:MAG: CusA/CzcA family heavy metal efflux RND transporter [Betaproteobacteria bacterium]|nr:CusA/CzcA family heavy metal efflux RND transporter [Betaproteobacteria bacterium]MCL2886063.1 CusA/CzcA family heavy metal efflux RND transporter [Betaproteobacteria bacterium]
MLRRLIARALAHRFPVLLLIVVLTAAGAMAFRALPIDAFPDIAGTQVKIIMKAPGMTPEEVEMRIVLPIEQELLGIPRQKALRSQSKYAIAEITLDFADGTDVYWARQQVAERLNAVQGDLPPTASGGLAPPTTPLGELFMFTIEGPMSLAEKRTLLDWTIRPQLRSLPGVADVSALGGEVKTFEVVPDINALAARGITLAQLAAAIEENNRNDGAGRIDRNEESLLVRGQGNISSLDDLGAIVVAEKDGQVTRVADVGTPRIGMLSRYGAVTKDGAGEAVEALVLALRGANARQVIQSVRAKLDEIQETLPEGSGIEVFYDRGDLVERAVGTVAKALGEAIFLVLALLFLFLGNLRAALAVACILPLSACATFILMRWFGLSANLMSLGGLAIAIGLLVDAAVVIVENIEAYTEARDNRPSISWLHTIYRASSDVAVPVAAGIAIIVTVFLPLLTLEGLEGKMFAPVALTIVFALAASLVLSLTVIPVLASFLLKEEAHQPPWLARKIEAIYAPSLEWALARPRLAVGSAVGALVVALALFPLIGKSFMPTLDEGDIIMQLEKLPSINLAQSIAIDQAIQKDVLARVPEVKSIVARAGSDELGMDPMGLNETDSFLVLKPSAEWRSKDKNAIVDALREVGRDFPGIDFSFTQPIEMRTSEMLSGVRGDLAVKIFGPDAATLSALAEKIVHVLEKIPGSEDVITVKNSGVQYMQITVDRLAAGRLGLNSGQLQSDLRALIEGSDIGVVIEEGRRLPLQIRGSDALRASPGLFTQLRLPLADGRVIPIREVASIELVDGPVKIERENASRMSVVRANVRGRDLVGFVDEAKAAVAAAGYPPVGYHLSWGGQFENQQRAAARLMVVVPIALGLIFLLLFATLGSARQAVLVFSNIPLALIGGIFALLLTGEYLSVPASVGFIALMGIAVLNGLVMITCFNQLAATGMAIGEVVREGARRRLRPVLMTASIAGFGLIPLLLATGPGSEIQRPLAIVVIGGLLSSTFLTLVILPILFERFGLERKS